MSRQANPTLIGAFVFGAVVLATLTVLLLAGNYLFRDRAEYILYFEGAAQGLQVGAPVVFLGVNVGTVKAIRIDRENGNFMVQVTVELDLDIIRIDTGDPVDAKNKLIMRQLVEQGLRARLNIQSLLTGQRFIDLDFYPDREARYISDDRTREIPTIPTRVEELTNMLENFPIDKFLADLAAISASAGKILSSEETLAIPARLEAILAQVESLAARLNSLGEPVVTMAEEGLGKLPEAIAAVQAAMDRVGKAAEQVEHFASADSSVSTSISQAGTELADAAQTLQQLSGNDSLVIQQLRTALQEISRAASALRVLAQSLEQQPEALLRGKNYREKY
ncbi:MAG: hypothetical protein ACD_75C01013G0002 [uncultured bacterium]|nr:MAG: hypothetical protein ACD_75C01013G0002 [uncultured bacterium]HBG18918.1 hypothetical protein [Desulfobulbaceae bacterium]